MYLFIYVNDPKAGVCELKINTVYKNHHSYTQDEWLPLCSQCSLYRLGLESFMSERRQPSSGNISMSHINRGRMWLFWAGLILLSTNPATQFLYF